MHRDLGGDEALARLRRRLQARGLKLMLDFVPNHMAPDHPWVDEHPDYFVQGSESDLGARTAQLLSSPSDSRPAGAGLRPRSVLRRLARHAAARLRQPGIAARR